MVTDDTTCSQVASEGIKAGQCWSGAHLARALSLSRPCSGVEIRCHRSLNAPLFWISLPCEHL